MVLQARSVLSRLEGDAGDEGRLPECPESAAAL